jgi:hypothetical protein
MSPTGLQPKDALGDGEAPAPTVNLKKETDGDAE